MLYDRGLQTLEQIKEHREGLKKRGSGSHHGCISSLICDNCNHLISDSICLCIGIFTCPNCGFRNGKELEKIMEESRKLPSIKFANTNGIISSNLISKEKVLEILKRPLKNLDLSEDSCDTRYIEEIEKL